jgi:hypothetical protein
MVKIAIAGGSGGMQLYIPNEVAIGADFSSRSS